MIEKRTAENKMGGNSSSPNLTIEKFKPQIKIAAKTKRMSLNFTMRFQSQRIVWINAIHKG